MNTGRKYFRELIVIILILLNLLVWTVVLVKKPGETLRVHFLDVGQGDAILIDTPTHQRMLIDGGANRRVLSEIGKIVPFFDREIDVVLATHPDRDHIGGLPEVVTRYNVEVFIEPGVISDNTIDAELHKRLTEHEIPILTARKGMRIDFGDGVKLLVLFPDKDVSGWETNDASIVARLDYGESSFLLTGDSPKKIEYSLLALGDEILESDVLKAGHHGSRTSTSLLFAEVISPSYAVISAGKDNSYGHPHKEVLDILNQIGAEIVGTAEQGTITFETNGTELYLK